jgi:hypothetical protein
MKSNERENFVKAWDDHIDDFNRLAFTPSMELSLRVKATMDILKDLVREVADDKIQASKKHGEEKA